MAFNPFSGYSSYFSTHPSRDGLIYLGIISFALYYGVAALAAETYAPNWNCTLPMDHRHFQNVLYPSDPCLNIRYKEIGWMTRREADFLRRILLAVALGALVGYERRSPDRPAGIRTMSITALGSCTFTLAGTFAFESGPMAWDASRISAAIPSGCGFLGAGLIWKGFVKQGGGEDVHQVHGLTTAASIWISAAIGTAAGGGMFFIATFSTLAIILILRFGPRNQSASDEDDDDDEEEERDNLADLSSLAVPVEGAPSTRSSYRNLELPMQLPLQASRANSVEGGQSLASRGSCRKPKTSDKKASLMTGS